ncbi:MAG TPA: flap endonuclease-1 [Nitrososphaeraceae archaeon]|jgi:flap endonuclease-1|nr:flap endonuclease-1 [Nitrososphaeraceae archaeon]
MGIDLKPILTTCPIKSSDLSDKIIAVDAYNTIYQFLATIRGPTGDSLTNNKGEITSHLSGLFYRNINFLTENIKFVYIFDGKPHSLKFNEIKRRKESKQEAIEKYQEALEEGRLEDAKKYSQGTVILTDEIIEQSKKILKMLGIPVIQAPSEGEATASILTKDGTVYACASQDYDSLLFGAKRLIRNLTITGKRKIPNQNRYVSIEPEIIHQSQVLESTKLTLEQLVDVAILIGTDFNTGGLPGIGPKTALKLIREKGRLEEIEKIKDNLKHVPYQQIREIFLNPENISIGNIEFDYPNYKEIIDFLCDTMDFSKERVESSLARLKKSQEKRSQSLERWF